MEYNIEGVKSKKLLDAGMIDNGMDTLEIITDTRLFVLFLFRSLSYAAI